MSRVFGCTGRAAMIASAPGEELRAAAETSIPPLFVHAECDTGTEAFVDDANSCVYLSGGTLPSAQVGKLGEPKAALEALRSLNGAFLFVGANKRTGEVLLAIDRSGVRNLYYSEVPGGLVFGSSAGEVARHSMVGSEIDPQSLFHYAYFHMVPGPRTIFNKVRRLVPGEYLHWAPDGMKLGRYWEITYDESRTEPFDALKREFLDIFQRSVADSIPSGKGGAFLSGGTDSSSIAGMLCKVTGTDFDTYSIGFAAEGFDEMEYARIASKHFGTRHHEYYVTPDDIVRAVPLLAASHEQPFGNSSAIPAYYCAQMARADGVTGLIGGDGGDEIFGGNARYAKQRVFSLYEALPGTLRSSLIEPLALRLPQGVPPLRKVRSYVEQASTPMPDRADSYNVLRRFGFDTVFAKDFLASVDTDEPLEIQAAWYNNPSAHSLINRMLAMDMKFTLADNDLPKVTTSCAMAGLPVAYPLLDDRMVAFSCKLAPELKLKGTKLRWFFKEALKGFLPPEIISKSKHGFGLPFGQWALGHGPLKALAFESIASLKQRGLFDNAFLDRLPALNEAHPNYYGNFVWVLMMLEQWFQHHATPARSA
ncbi:MAG: asparagine synthase [Zoogloeaceae bacterium]|nr:asparagine synthase [Zoogloeaceae bacterium]